MAFRGSFPWAGLGGDLRQQTMTDLPQQEFIGDQTARYTCKACGTETTVHKEKHIHEHRLCGGCYDHIQPHLSV